MIIETNEKKEDKISKKARLLRKVNLTGYFFLSKLMKFDVDEYQCRVIRHWA